MTTMAIMTSVGHAIVVTTSTFYSLIRHRRHHDRCRMWSRKCLPFRSTWVSIFYVIVLSFGCWVLIVPFVWLLVIYIFSLINTYCCSTLSTFDCVMYHSWFEICI